MHVPAEILKESLHPLSSGVIGGGKGWCHAFHVKLWGRGEKFNTHITMPFLFPCQHNHTWGKPIHFTGDGNMEGELLQL